MNLVIVPPGSSKIPFPSVSRSCRYTCVGPYCTVLGANVVDDEMKTTCRPSPLIEWTLPSLVPVVGKPQYAVVTSSTSPRNGTSGGGPDCATTTDDDVKLVNAMQTASVARRAKRMNAPWRELASSLSAANAGPDELFAGNRY